MTDANESAETPIEQQSTSAIPRITIKHSDQNQPVDYQSSSTSESGMSSSHHSSHHHHSSTSSKGKHTSSSPKSKSKEDDWAQIKDPEERRRVQNRIAQRKFRDKNKEAKERQERDAENRAQAGNSYRPPDPREMGPEVESGLPWGSVNMKHIYSTGEAKQEESRRSSGKNVDTRTYEAQGPTYEERSAYYTGESENYEDGDRAYYDYGSRSGSYHGSSR